MVKHVSRFTLQLAAIALLGGAILLGILSSKPRDIENLLPTIEASLNPADGSYRIKIASASIDWRKLNQFGRITLTNITVSLADGKVFAVVPRVQVSLSALSMLIGQVKINWLIIPNAVLVLTRDEQNQMRVGFDSKQANIPLSALLDNPSSSPSSAKPFRQFSLPFKHALLENAHVFIRDTAGKLLLKTYDSDLSFDRTPGGVKGALRLNFLYKGQRGAAHILLDYIGASSRVTFNTQLSRIPSGIICAFSPECGAMKGVKGIISGKIATIIAAEKVDSVNAAIIMDNATLDKPEWFEKSLEFSRIGIIGQASQHLRNIQLTTLDVQSPDVRILANGSALRTDRGVGLDMNASVLDLKASDLPDYWPKNMLPDTKLWIQNNISRGLIKKASMHIKMTPEEASLPVLPDHALQALIKVNNAKVRFIPRLEPISNLTGSIAFTGQTMKAELANGTMYDATKVSKAFIYIADLNHKNMPMEAVLSVTASARDAAQLLTHPAFVFDDILSFNEEKITGNIAAELKLNFDAYSDDFEEKFESNEPMSNEETAMDLSKVSYDIAMQFNDLSQPNFMDFIDVTYATGQLRANDEGITMKANGSLYDSAMQIGLSQNSGEDVHLSANGKVNRDTLIALGMPDRKELGQGSAAFEVNAIVKKDDAWIEKANFDFKDMGLSIPDISWEKSVGAPAKFSVTLTNPRQYQWQFAGENLASAGKLSLSDEGKDIEEFSIDSLKNTENQFTLQYKKQGKKLHIDLKGDALDNSIAYANSSNSILADFPAIDLSLHLKKLTLVKEHPLSNVVGTLSCDELRCSASNFSANMGDKSLSASITHKNDARNFSLTSNDAGQTLGVFGLSDRVFGGSLSAFGAYDDNESPPKLNGKIVIDKFVVRQSEILGRIFSVASLSGLSNALTGSGISFDELRADFESQDGLFTLQNGRAHGNAVGYTTEGSINTRDASLSLKGVLVPAYALNSMVNNIPVIGMIAGGKGEGIISFNYGVKGAYSDPEVSVNPLSGLTPGFLRNIFGVFEQAQKKPEDVRQKEKTKKN